MAQTTGARFLTVSEVLERGELPLGRTALYEAIRRGDIPHVRVGRKLLLPADVGDRLLARANGEERAAG